MLPLKVLELLLRLLQLGLGILKGSLVLLMRTQLRSQGLHLLQRLPSLPLMSALSSTLVLGSHPRT